MDQGRPRSTTAQAPTHDGRHMYTFVHPCVCVYVEFSQGKGSQVKCQGCLRGTS